MANLESAVRNLGRGFITGLAGAVDPVGLTLKNFDTLTTGYGPAEAEAPDTVPNLAYKLAYKDLDRRVPFGKGYASRLMGKVVGAAGGLAGLTGLYLVGGPVAAVAAPAILGIYSLGTTIKDYVKGFFGKVPEGERKAKFSDGFKYGWHVNTHSYLRTLHQIEYGLTGRGINQSGINSSMKSSADKMRYRNFTGVAGRFVGGIFGLAASILSLGLIPIYKSVRDTVKTVEENRPAYQPA